MIPSKKQPPRGATRIVKKEKRQFRMPKISVSVNWVYVVAPILLVGLLVAGYLSAQNMLIKEVRIKGDFSIWSDEFVVQQVNWVVGEKFFAADIDKVYSSLISIPLIEQVKITKKWPGYIEIGISEAIPMAIWNREKIISASGKVSDIPSHLKDANLAVINTNPEYINQAIKSFTLIQSEVKAHNVKINELSMLDTGSISLLLNNGWTVDMGRKNMNLRIHRLDKILEKMSQKDISGVDFRYGNGVAVKWHEKLEGQG